MFPQHICFHIKPLIYVTQRPTDANTQIIILHLLVHRQSRHLLKADLIQSFSMDA